MQNNEMFSRLKVVELASVLAGPAVGQFFAELGAGVVKVENLKTGGDVTRTWKVKGENTGEVSAYFSSVNWGKMSLAIDLSKWEGREIVHELVRDADIVIASYKPGDAEKLGVDFDSLKKINSSLIYGQITGYGSTNDRVGYDAVIQAESGFMDLNGEKGGQPLKMPVALIDVLAAHHLKEGLLVALLRRQISGKGELVEVSLIQAAISSLANQAANYLIANTLPRRQGSIHPNIAPYGENYQTQDGKRILLAIGSDRQFADLCKICGLPELGKDQRFSTNASRVVNREELGKTLEKAISGMNSADLSEKFNEFKIPGGIVQNLAEVFAMEEAKNMLIEIDGLRGVRNLASLHSGHLQDISHILPPPGFGEHTEEVLGKKLGFSAQKVALLRQNSIIL